MPVLIFKGASYYPVRLWGHGHYNNNELKDREPTDSLA